MKPTFKNTILLFGILLPLVFAQAGIILPGAAQASPAQNNPAQKTPQVVTLNPTVPREKIDLICTEDYYKTERKNFILQDETYNTCTLRVPLELNKLWPGRRNYYVVPRVAASLHTVGKDQQGRWLPLSSLANPGLDPLHRLLDSKTFKAVELVGSFGRMSDKVVSITTEKTGQLQPDAISAGGKLTVCVAPVYRSENPCITWDVSARFKIYKR